MNLKEKLKTAQSELLELKTKIESGDAEAIKRAGELTTEIENLKEQIKTAEKATQLLAQIGNGESEQEGAKDTRSKSLGEHFVFFYIALIALDIFLVIYITNKNEPISYRVAWIVLISVFSAFTDFPFRQLPVQP